MKYLKTSLILLGSLFVLLSALFLRSATLTNEVAIKAEVISVYPTPLPTSFPTPIPINLNSQTLWNLVNDWRAKNGLSTYTWNEELCDLAKERMPMIKRNWSHDGFVETVDRRFAGRYRDIAENLARGYLDEDDTLTAWLNSPIHKKFLDYNYHYSCVVTSGSYSIETFGNF